MKRPVVEIVVFYPGDGMKPEVTITRADKEPRRYFIGYTVEPFLQKVITSEINSGAWCVNWQIDRIHLSPRFGGCDG